MHLYQSKTRDGTHLQHGCRVVWSYFGFRHGKEVHDGAGTILKQEIKKEQVNMDATKLQNATDVLSFCLKKQQEKHSAYPNARRQVSHFFHLVNPRDVNRSATWDCKNIMGTCSLHFVDSISHRDVTLLNLRNLA